MSVGKHTIINLAGAIVPMGVALLTVPAYLAHVGAERYGALVLIWTLLNYFGFFDLGVGRAVAQRMSRLTQAQDTDRSNLLWTAITCAFILGSAGSLALWAGMDLAIDHVIHVSPQYHAEVSTGLKWLLAALPMLLLASTMTGALQARLKFVELNLIQGATGVLGQVLPLIVAMSGYVEISYLVPTVLLTRLLGICLMFGQCRRHVPLRGRPVLDGAHLKPLLHYGGWISAISVLAPLLVTVDRMVIGSLLGARAVAHYTVPYDLVSKVMVLSNSFSSALFPRLAAATEAQGRVMAQRASATLVAVMSPLIIVGISIVHAFLKVWVGENFAATCIGVAELILVGVWINAAVIPHYSRFMATSSPRIVALIYAAEIPAYFLVLWQLISLWGVAGAAAAWTLRVLIDALVLLRLNRVLGPTIQSALPSLALVLCALGLQWTGWADGVRMLLGLGLAALCLVKDRALLTAAYDHVRPARPHAS